MELKLYQQLKAELLGGLAGVSERPDAAYQHVKKFYAFMLEKAWVAPQAMNELTLTIKRELPKWIANAERYDDELDDDY